MEVDTSSSSSDAELRYGRTLALLLSLTTVSLLLLVSRSSACCAFPQEPATQSLPERSAERDSSILPRCEVYGQAPKTPCETPHWLSLPTGEHRFRGSHWYINLRRRSFGHFM